MHLGEAPPRDGPHGPITWKVRNTVPEGSACSEAHACLGLRTEWGSVCPTWWTRGLRRVGEARLHEVSVQEGRQGGLAVSRRGACEGSDIQAPWGLLTGSRWLGPGCVRTSSLNVLCQTSCTGVGRGSLHSACGSPWRSYISLRSITAVKRVTL